MTVSPTSDSPVVRLSFAEPGYVTARPDHAGTVVTQLETERELMVARDHLMAIEVKLDILEGAANVLDRRTRITAPQDQHESSARA